MIYFEQVHSVGWIYTASTVITKYHNRVDVSIIDYGMFLSVAFVIVLVGKDFERDRSI